jgi:DAK2 domain fusion protein YloV
LAIKGKTLRDAIISGANHIANNRQQVDALNVFPVPDGDTGTNMSMTIGAAKRELEQLGDEVGVGAVAQTAASALLRGARGNSGVILSLLFRGFSKGLSGKITADPSDIADAFSLGVEAAYKAVMKPTEGTILTVSRLAADRAREVSAAVGDDLGRLWDEMLWAAREALERTPDMLPVLKKAGVVDAGGKGYIVVLEGMGSVIREDMIIPPAGETGLTLAPVPMPAQGGHLYVHDVHNLEEEITFTYCTEFIVLKEEARQANPLSLRAYLESIGDCVVVVDDDEIIKIHVHTDNPGDALQEGLKYGMITNIKIENMREQYAREKAAAQSRAQSEEYEPMRYTPVNPEREYGFVAVAAGEGVKRLFADLGVDNVVTGGQTMNPSTESILQAVHATPAKTVFVLPNNKNIIMAAEQTVRMADRKVQVLHTKSIPQGLPALLAFDQNSDAVQNHMEMMRAAERVGTGQITYAARDSEYDGHKIKEGELLALENGKLAFTDRDIVRAAVRLTRSLLRHENSSFVTVLYGQDVTQEDAAKVEEAVRAKCPEDVEVVFLPGGQPVYYYIISVE